MKFDGDGRIREIITPPSPSYLKRGSGGVTQINGDLTYEEQLLLALLKPGKENANSVKYLAGILKTGEVQLRMMVKHLVEKHGFVIVSSTGKTPGYFFPEGHEEYQRGVNQLVNRIRSLAVRLRALDKGKYEAIFGQGVLDG